MCHLFFKLNDERQVKFLEKYLHLNICIFHEQYIKNSHTCKESGAHLRIYFWHFLINLNNNYLLKNCWSGPIKNVRVLIFKMLYLKKKKKKKNLKILLFSTCVPTILKIWSTVWNRSVTDWNWQFCIIFCPFPHQNPWKIRILKK